MFSIAQVFAVSVLWSGATSDSGNHALPLELSVMDTADAKAIVDLKTRLSSNQFVPDSIVRAGKQMLGAVRGDFRHDIATAAVAAAKAACSDELGHYSGRLRAMAFSERFWNTLDHGKTYQSIRHHVQSGENADLLFTEFQGKYLNEFATAWGMRTEHSALTNACLDYGVDDVSTCLKAILVVGAAPPACNIELADHMFVYLPQPSP